MKRAALVLWCLTASAACAAPFGLAVGSTWTYKVRSDETVHIRSTATATVTSRYDIRRTERIDRADTKTFPAHDPAFVLMQVDEKTDEAGRKSRETTEAWLARNADGLWALGHRDDAPDGRLVRFVPPDHVYPWPLKVGKTWTSDIRIEGLRIRVRNEVLATEDVKAGGKTYAKAYRVQTRSESVTGVVRIRPGLLATVKEGNIRQTCWVAPEIGDVLWQERIAMTLEMPLEDSPLQQAAFRVQGRPAPDTATISRTVAESGELLAFRSGEKD